jgi:hypothetical protein
MNLSKIKEIFVRETSYRGINNLMEVFKVMPVYRSKSELVREAEKKGNLLGELEIGILLDNLKDSRILSFDGENYALLVTSESFYQTLHDLGNWLSDKVVVTEEYKGAKGNIGISLRATA